MAAATLGVESIRHDTPFELRRDARQPGLSRQLLFDVLWRWEEMLPSVLYTRSSLITMDVSLSAWISNVRRLEN